MELVEATATDLDVLVAYWYDLAERMADHSDLNELADGGISEEAKDGFRAHLDDDAVTDYLIVVDDEPIGFLTLREGSHPSRRYSEYLRLENILIEEDHRGRGHGSAVVARVKREARERGCDLLKVSCEWENEDARRFYRDAGFEPKQVDYAQVIQ